MAMFGRFKEMSGNYEHSRTGCAERVKEKQAAEKAEKAKNEILEPSIQAERISDFEQISEIPENELKEVLEQFDAQSLVIASMGASPEINKLLERLFQNIDYELLRGQIGVVRITEVEAIQKEIVSMINL